VSEFFVRLFADRKESGCRIRPGSGARLCTRHPVSDGESLRAASPAL